jgi:hypothetical protein
MAALGANQAVHVRSTLVARMTNPKERRMLAPKDKVASHLKAG